jgi:hypothetical protein
MKLLSTFFLFISFLLLNSCGFRVLPLTGSYAEKPYEFGISSKDQSWKNLIDYLTEKGIAIKLIDKASGIITTEPTSLLNAFTWENKDGSLTNPDAFVVCSKVRAPLQIASSLKPTELRGQWVFLFKEEGEKNYLLIRFTNGYGKVLETTSGDSGSSAYTYNLDVKSTGLFEKQVQEQLN